MELFYSDNIQGTSIFLDQEESAHCVRVLRHRPGDEVCIINGRGSLYRCTLTDASSREASARIETEEKGFGSHPYHLTMAVCPTKNIDRYEWFAEKATEIGVDEIVPVIGDHSERKVFKPERMHRILLSATKQSLKGAIPELRKAVSVREFIASADPEDLNLIAYCFEGENLRKSIVDVLGFSSKNKISVLIGPEGDFSREEAEAAIAAGFIPIHLGPSRLRTETAALTAVQAVYLQKL